MTITEEQAKERLEHPKNLVNLLVEHRRLNSGGKKPGDLNMPEALREVIAVTSKVSGATETAEAFGVCTQEEVSQLKHNKVGSPEFLDRVNDRAAELKGELKDRALAVAMKSVGLLDDPKRLESTKTRDIAAIAKDMSTIHRNLSEEGKATGGVANFIVFTPRVKDRSEYGVAIEVESKPLV